MKFILGRKQEMTQVHSANGAVKPVTVLRVGPCFVTQIKTVEKDGYTATQFGYAEKRNVSRALRGHEKGIFTGKDGRGFQFIKELRGDAANDAARGSGVTASSFVAGDIVQVTAWSKGRGFTGVVKRHHFHGHPTSHGHKDQERMPGSIGAGGNQHVFKGLRMAGRMGNEQVTVKNLEVVSVDAEKGLIMVKGAVPGCRNGLVIVQAPGEMSYESPASAQAETAPAAAPEVKEEVVEAPSETGESAIV